MTENRWRFATVCAWVLAGLLAISAVTVRVSTMTSSVRILLAGMLLFGVFTGLVFLVNMLAVYHRLIYPTIFFIGLFALWAAIGSKQYNVEILRSMYVRRVGSFEGDPYLRGGETDLGIDGPGLARTALWQAVLRQGMREFNSSLLGPMLWRFWWRDMDARDILRGEYGYTKVIGRAPKLAGYNASKLRQGDIAITNGASHVLIYNGKDGWFEASRTREKVVLHKVSAISKRHAFNLPVTFVRWWILGK